MSPLRLAFAFALALAAAGCIDNTAPGNDREAELDPPPAPARMAASAGAAIQGVAIGLLQPQIMTDADRASIPEAPDRCLFRMTRVGLPVLVYGSSAVVKLNDRLVTLPAAGEGTYSADGVTVMVRPLEADEGDDGLVPAELVLRLPGAPNELGYHGFTGC
jgi:hypothetical protein